MSCLIDDRSTLPLLFMLNHDCQCTICFYVISTHYMFLCQLSTAYLLLPTKLGLFPTIFNLRFWLLASNFNLDLRGLQLLPNVYLLWQQARVSLFVLCSCLYDIFFKLCSYSLVRCGENCNFLQPWLEKGPPNLEKIEPISVTSSSFRYDNS